MADEPHVYRPAGHYVYRLTLATIAVAGAVALAYTGHPVLAGFPLAAGVWRLVRA